MNELLLSLMIFMRHEIKKISNKKQKTTQKTTYCKYHPLLEYQNPDSDTYRKELLLKKHHGLTERYRVFVFFQA